MNTSFQAMFRLIEAGSMINVKQLVLALLKVCERSPKRSFYLKVKNLCLEMDSHLSGLLVLSDLGKCKALNALVFSSPYMPRIFPDQRTRVLHSLCSPDFDAHNRLQSVRCSRICKKAEIFEQNSPTFASFQHTPGIRLLLLIIGDYVFDT